jgi:predicted permease
MLRGITRDIVFAGRLFRRQPGIVLLTVSGLALAIGVSTAVFSLVNALTIRGYGIRDPGDVVRLELRENSQSTVWRMASYEELRRAPSIEVAATGRSNGHARVADRPSDRLDGLPAIQTLSVSGSFFAVMRTRPAAGRLLGPDDDRPGAPPVIVLSSKHWMSVFGGDPAVVGRTIWLENRATVVVGVAEAGFALPVEPRMRPPDGWMTLSSSFEAQQQREALRTRGVQERIDAITSRGATTEDDRDRLQILASDLKWKVQPLELSDVTVFGRLAPAVSRAQAGAEAASIATVTAAAILPAGPRPVRSVNLVQANQPPPATILGAGIPVVLCGVILLILLACANVANLLLASTATRDREIATRLALGAGRGRILRQLATESVVLGGIGGVLGLLIASWLAPIVTTLIGFRNEDVTPDLTVYAFGVVATIVVALAASLAPARHSRRDGLADALKTGRPGSGTHASAGRLRTILVASQAAVSILLLIVGAVLTRAFVQAATFDHGLATDRLISVQIWFGRGFLKNPARMDRYWNDALERVRALPGVAGASLATDAPFDGTTNGQRTALVGTTRNSTRSDYFDVAGARLRRGRVYSSEEVRDGAAVVVITERLAKTFWGDENPIGSDMSRVWGAGDPPGTPRDWSSHPRDARVIGVIADAMDKLEDYNRATIYLPITLEGQRHANLIVRAEADAEVVVGPIRDAVAALDPDVEIGKIGTARSGLSRELTYPRSQALFALLVSGSALGLAVIGLFGVTAFAVGQRRHEVGIRVALGATHRSVVRLMLRDNLKPVVVGLVAGILGSLFVTQLIRVNLYGIGQRDPLAMAAAAVVRLAAAGVAAFVPARRAALVDPVEMLRQ